MSILCAFESLSVTKVIQIAQLLPQKKHTVSIGESPRQLFFLQRKVDLLVWHNCAVVSLKHVNIDVITDADAVSCLVQTFCDHHLSGLQPVTNCDANFAVNGVVSCL